MVPNRSQTSILRPSTAAQALITSSPWRNAFIQASAKAAAWAAHLGQASADHPATWVRPAMPGSGGMLRDGDLRDMFEVSDNGGYPTMGGTAIFGNLRMFTMKYYKEQIVYNKCIGKPNETEIKRLKLSCHRF